MLMAGNATKRQIQIIESRLKLWLRKDDYNEMLLSPNYPYIEQAHIDYHITLNMAFLIALHQRNREAG